MGSAIKLRSDYDGVFLRRLAKASRDAGQTRRLLALASVYDGGSRSHAAKVGGVGLQVIRDWVLRFNEHGADGLIGGKAPGKTPLLSDEQRRALAEAVEAGPKPYLDGVVRWRLVDLGRVAVGGVRLLGEPPDAGARAAGHGVPEALGAPATLRPEPGGDRGV